MKHSISTRIGQESVNRNVSKEPRRLFIGIQARGLNSQRFPYHPPYLASNRSTTGSCENILGHVTIRAAQNVPQSLRMFRLGAAQLECTVRKVRKRLYRGLSSVRTSAKAACQHSPRAK